MVQKIASSPDDADDALVVVVTGAAVVLVVDDDVDAVESFGFDDVESSARLPQAVNATDPARAAMSTTFGRIPRFSTPEP